MCLDLKKICRKQAEDCFESAVSKERLAEFCAKPNSLSCVRKTAKFALAASPRDPGFPYRTHKIPPAPKIPENYSKITIWPIPGLS